mmetsp:Transcript_23601/g.27296  ORF Transcript_23601/g.27296 Transcript_23601/m.27296 type:complete len:239 (+) Transcript_23601:93-809(+)
MSVSKSGALTCIPQEHILCGLCRSSFMVCSCTGLKHGMNYVFDKLPEPPEGGTSPGQLIKRWTSIVAMSTRLGRFDSERWYMDNSSTVLAAINLKSDTLRQMLEDYIATLDKSPQLSMLATCVKCKSSKKATQLEAISSEARVAMSTFLSGDWSCITFIGTVLLQNAFQASDPQKYPLNDPQLVTIFQCGVGLLSSILQMGYDEWGYHLALESDRNPIIQVGGGMSRDTLSAFQRFMS